MIAALGIMQMQDVLLLIMAYCTWLPSVRFPARGVLDEFSSAYPRYPTYSYGRRALVYSHESPRPAESHSAS